MNDSQKIALEFSITDLTEINTSFDKGTIKVCYAGANRNKSIIEKNVIENAIPTIFNCPVVCNYDVYENTIGGHDIDIITDKDGNTKMIHLTEPVGVVPESAAYWWEKVENEKDTKEYLCVEAIIWKRCNAYEKISSDGSEKHSMEISVEEGETMPNGFYRIDKFSFLAFCLLGNCEPCFEDSKLVMFSSSQNIASIMNEEYAKSVNEQNSSNTYNFENFERRLKRLENIIENGEVIETGSEAEVVEEPKERETAECNFSTETAGAEELSAPEGSPEEEVPAPAAEEPVASEDFELASNLYNVMLDAVRELDRMRDEWGEHPRYFFEDYDAQEMLVYVVDQADHWNPYHFAYKMDGDNVVIDKSSKKRCKRCYKDFDEGEEMPEASFGISEIVNEMTESAKSFYEEKIGGLEEQVKSLSEFKKNADENEIKNVFSKFSALTGIEAYDKLAENHDGMTAEEIEDKCYSIKGRNEHLFAVKVDEGIRIPASNHTENTNKSERYGDIFEKFPPKH